MNINILVLISLRNPLAHDIILLYRTNYFIMQNGIFYYAEWNISLCRMEYFIVQNGIFYYAEWNILLCTMEYFIMQNGIFHYAEWNISLCRMEYSYTYNWILDKCFLIGEVPFNCQNTNETTGQHLSMHANHKCWAYSMIKY